MITAVSHNYHNLPIVKREKLARIKVDIQAFFVALTNMIDRDLRPKVFASSKEKIESFLPKKLSH